MPAGLNVPPLPLGIAPDKISEWRDLMSEVYVLDLVRGHPNFVQLLDAFVDMAGKSKAYIVMERFGLSLAGILSQVKAEDPDCKGFCPTFLRDVAFQASHALMFLHQKSLLHGDLKPQNMLGEVLGSHLTVQVADLGSSCQVSDPSHATSVTSVRS